MVHGSYLKEKTPFVTEIAFNVSYIYIKYIINVLSKTFFFSVIFLSFVKQ